MNFTTTAEEAFTITRTNPARAWTGSTEKTAQSRFKLDDFLPLHHVPKFGLDREDPVFTIGSCFARSVESVLLEMKVPLALDGHGVQNQFLASWDEARDATPGRRGIDPTRGALNKYSVHSMTHDIRRSLLNERYANDGLIELSSGRWFDPHSSGTRHLTLEEATECRNAISLAMKQVSRSKVVFITLGLTESWLDLETGLVMNGHPGAQYFKKFATRFQFIDYGYQAILEELQSLLDLIRREAQTGIRFIITVSPVPLGSTFRPLDIIVANSASKSTLRAVANQIQLDCPDVDYFPSYEFVVNSPRGRAWMDDHHHVAAPMVSHIMRCFKQSYYGDDT